MASPELLAARRIDVVRVERGGEVTYHGPGQLVAYPIVALSAPGRDSGSVGSRTLGVRPFVEALEGAMADTCASAGIAAGPRTGHPGCWVDADGPFPRKIGALGIRVARGVAFHGIALNVTTDLADFDLIDPCGTPGLRSTSIARERMRASDSHAGGTGDWHAGGAGAWPVDAAGSMGAAGSSGTFSADPDGAPTTASVAQAAAAFAPALARRLGMELAGNLPANADPADERRSLEALVAGAGARSSPPTAVEAR
jgi:lipoate-protein ligase B